MNSWTRIATGVALVFAVAGPARAAAPVATPPQTTAVPAQATPANPPPNEYLLGNEDEISISVWMHPELDRKVQISQDGTITFPPLGDIPAAGLTAKKLSDRLADRLSTYLRSTTTVTVTVTRYLSHSVTVSGAVSQPGRYGFPEVPNLLDVINAAGGAVPGADLSRVQIIRQAGPDRGTKVADVLTAQRTGTANTLPQLKPGDTIIIPAFSGAYAPAPGDGFAVLGEVQHPGIYQASGGSTSIWLALAQGGGTTSVGDIGKIKLVRLSPEGQQVSTVNLKEVLREGGRSAPVVRAGDVVYVPHTSASTAAKGWTGIRELLSVSADLVNIVIIADYLDRQSPK